MRPLFGASSYARRPHRSAAKKTTPETAPTKKKVNKKPKPKSSRQRLTRGCQHVPVANDAVPSSRAAGHSCAGASM